MTAAKLITDVISTEPSYVATTKATASKATYVTPSAEATAAARIRRVDTEAAAEECES